MNAGDLRERVTVLSLTETDETWSWTPERLTWARVEEKTGKNLFSTVGLGARSVSLTLRRQALTLHQAILWRGKHCFLTDIRDNGRLYWDVDAAVVTPVACSFEGTSFPAVRTEKYLGWNRDVPPMSVNEFTFVLVVPKAVPLLTPGHLVTVAGEEWEVRVPHTLDEYKNEYEVARTVEL
jgi:hypothetical protein